VVESLYRIRPSTRLGVYLAKTYMGLDRYAEATDLLLQLNGGRSHSKEMGNTLAISFLAQGRYQEALQVAALTIAKFGASHSLLMAQGKAQFYLKQFKPALRSFEQAKKLDDADEENIIKTAEFVKENILRNPRMELLPYHRYGESKYETLNITKPSEFFGRSFFSPKASSKGEVVLE